jgi:N utilization substance protein B
LKTATVVPLRRKARELAMQVLYQCETTGQDIDQALGLAMANFEANKKAYAYARELLMGIGARRIEIDELIREQSVHWRLERMALVDLNILRIGVYELCACPDVPPSVVINEALEVASRYSADDANSFINGILDAVKVKLGRK